MLNDVSDAGHFTHYERIIVAVIHLHSTSVFCTFLCEKFLEQIIGHGPTNTVTRCREFICFSFAYVVGSSIPVYYNAHEENTV